MVLWLGSVVDLLLLGSLDYCRNAEVRSFRSSNRRCVVWGGSQAMANSCYSGTRLWEPKDWIEVLAELTCDSSSFADGYDRFGE